MWFVHNSRLGYGAYSSEYHANMNNTRELVIMRVTFFKLLLVNSTYLHFIRIVIFLVNVL